MSIYNKTQKEIGIIKPNNKSITVALAFCIALVGASVFVGQAYAAVSNQSVNHYSESMKAAANAKKASAVSALIADDAMIKFTRNGKNSTLNKANYLKLLQDRWDKSDNYSYHISVSNIVVTGDQAIADIKTVETFSEGGQPVQYISDSKATLVEQGGKLVLSKFKADISIK